MRRLRRRSRRLLVNSCLVPALQADGAKIRTIEGVAGFAMPLDGESVYNDRLNAVQQAFLTHGGAQCGICTPGMILAAVNLLERNPHPSDSRNSRRARRKSLPLHRLHENIRVRPRRLPCHAATRGAAALRSYVPAYQMETPRDLSDALERIAREPGAWKPFAGGTDLMVLLEAGKLSHRRFLNIWKLPELRGIEETPAHMTLGALTTYTETRGNKTLAREFPLLCRAAAETGSVATQNRGTLGGNIANASPAADSPPALLVYNADLELVSGNGSRWLPYHGFWTGYKQTQLATRRIDSPHPAPALHRGLAALLPQSGNAPRASHLESLLCRRRAHGYGPNCRCSHCARQRRADGFARCRNGKRIARREVDAGGLA